MPAMEICERARNIWVCESKMKRGQEGERSQTNLKKKTKHKQKLKKNTCKRQILEVDEIEDEEKKNA